MKKRLFSGILAVLISGLYVAEAEALKVEYLPAFAPASGGAVRPAREVVSGEVLVKFSAAVSSAAKAGLLGASGFGAIGELPLSGWTLVRLPEGMRVHTALDVLKTLAGVERAEPDGVYRPSVTPNDPSLVLQYGFRKTDAFRAWDYETGASSRVTVAVIDTGIDGAHPELQGKLAGTSQFFDPDNGSAQSADQPPTAACNHATRVAGVAAASSDNAYGIAGVSWGAKLLSLKIFNNADCKPGCSDAVNQICGSSDSAIAKAIAYAVDLHNSGAMGKIVVNMSVGLETQCSAPLQAVVTNAVNSGLLLVSAAGNHPVEVNSPANCDGVIPVGATDIDDTIASFSANDDLVMKGYGVSAPGVNVYTTDLNNSFAYASGTSFSSPFAAGLAALVWSANPAFSNTQVASCLRNSADDLGVSGPDASYGYGRVNLYKAVLLALQGNLDSYSSPQEEAGAFPSAHAYPNPYKLSSGRPLSFFIPNALLSESKVIKIYTTDGEMVKKLSEPLWDGTNEAGHKVASGVYLFFMKTDKGTAKGKFAVLR
jgi:subtilisin family serine protease